MPRSPSVEAAKGGNKKKGTRSVSTLTPSQLERKRANDREAQRAIRARTKEHIDRLEREISELKGSLNRDRTVQELLQKNRALEEELYRLKESMRQPSGHSYPASGMPLHHHAGSSSSSSSSPTAAMLTMAPSFAVYDDNLSSVGGAGPSPRSSPFPTSGGYGGMAELGPSYVPLPDTANETWAPAVPVSVPSSVSSPSSSANTDEYGAPAYIPTSIPAPMMEARSVPSKMDYDDVDSASVGPLSRHAGTPLWKLPPQTLPPSDSPQEWVLRFLQDCRQLAQTRRVDDLFRLERINLKAFLEYQPSALGRDGPRTQLHDLERALDPGHSATMTDHPITILMAALNDNVGVTNVLERLGAFVVLTRVVSWLVQLTKESYDLLGDLAPRSSQLAMAHPVWVELMPTGTMRDAIVERQDLYSTPEFYVDWAASARLVNWPYRAVDALNVNEETGDVWISDAFVAHAMRGDNWRQCESFGTRWPGLRRFTVAME
ncbi:hypothetical protein F5X68DRAFT_253214 [Plectosphaerella plurivora]|uniref:BZIP transcription factor n=1 Tax=Plectosphaerella plurivora TaxID=936078 RepID=A0A9P8VF22_9PEZI|nr:hypothetical protein F5X68DRAFT_253214 [Plectosphaerella plurivora]